MKTVNLTLLKLNQQILFPKKIIKTQTIKSILKSKSNYTRLSHQVKPSHYIQSLRDCMRKNHNLLNKGLKINKTK